MPPLDDAACAQLIRALPSVFCKSLDSHQIALLLENPASHLPHASVTKPVAPERPGYVTVIQNGVCVLNHFEIQGSTAWDKPPIYEKHADRMPILLQNHGNPVRFRNIWVRELTPPTGKKPAAS